MPPGEFRVLGHEDAATRSTAWPARRSTSALWPIADPLS